MLCFHIDNSCPKQCDNNGNLIPSPFRTRLDALPVDVHLTPVLDSRSGFSSLSTECNIHVPSPPHLAKSGSRSRGGVASGPSAAAEAIAASSSSSSGSRPPPPPTAGTPNEQPRGSEIQAQPPIRNDGAQGRGSTNTKSDEQNDEREIVDVENTNTQPSSSLASGDQERGRSLRRRADRDAHTHTRQEGQNQNVVFLPLQLTPDAARASLVQMNEISRRAGEVGFSFAHGQRREEGRAAGGGRVVVDTRDASANAGVDRGGGKENGGGGGMLAPTPAIDIIDRPSSRIWAAAYNAGLLGPGPGSNSGSGSGSGPEPESGPGSTHDFVEDGNGREDEAGVGGGGAEFRAGGGTWTGSATHEGLQVYTVGHLMPRDATGGMALGLNFGNAPGMGVVGVPDSSGNANGGMGGGIGEAEGEEEEVVPASNNNQPFVGGATEEGGWVPERNAANSASPIAGPGAYPFEDPSSSTMGRSNGPTAVSTSSGPAPASGTRASSKQASQKLRVRRTTFVPAWAVPPRVLLVDDDRVSRDIGSKFLQVYGCTTDVAVDGVGAVNKMNLEKYDLVLMDIVMPKLDGISATSLIRKFDHMTPIISMTGNSKPNDIMTYYSSGMNDILPKPFTKEGLFEMLEKHLTHLKLIQQMTRVPRSVGVPPLSDSGFEQAFSNQLAVTAGPGAPPPDGIMPLVPSSSLPPPPPYEDDGRINPLAGMGLTDDQYCTMLQNMMNGQHLLDGMGMGMEGRVEVAGSGRREKRGLEMGDEDDGRNGKRSRFEVVE